MNISFRKKNVYDEIQLCTSVYEDEKLNRTRINGLTAWFEPCVYDVYDEIDQNSEKNKNCKSYRAVTLVTFRDFLYTKISILNKP